MRVIEALCGPLNCHSPSIETLAGRFGYQGCIAKSVIMITDMDTDNKPDLARAASKINAISGEDPVTVERKGVTDWNGHLPGRLWLANNALPNFGTHAAATAFRALVLPFEVSFAGRENPNLTAELKGELAGILNWSLDGHDRLAARGHFVEPAECAAAKVRMLHVSDPIHGFGEEWCRFHPRAAVDKDALFDGYQDFCRTCGVRPMPKHTFAERFLQVFPETASARPRRGDKRPYVFSGVRFNDDQMIARYRHDPELVSFFGAKSPTTVERDANRWPIPLNASGEL